MPSIPSINYLPDDCLLVTQRQQEFQAKSCLDRTCNWKEKKNADDEFYNRILSYFDQTFKIHDLQHTTRVWEFVLKAHKINWKKGDDLSGAKFKQIYQAFQKALLYTGSGVDYPLYDIHELTEFLFGKKEMRVSDLFKWENFKKLFLAPDAGSLTQFRTKLQEGLKAGLSAFEAGEISEATLQAFTFNIVALIPYTYPQEGATIQIPVKNGEGVWEMALYQVDKKFQMTPAWFSTPLPVYGLLSEDAPPILACLGTTYPPGEGFVATLLSDFTPGFSPGHVACLYGRKEMTEWLKDKKNVRVAGTSLGGAISFHLSRLHSEAISEVYAFNPAGLYPCDWRGVDHSQIAYHIYSNDNDVVSTMGVFPEGENVHVYRVLTSERENFIASHSNVYHALKRVTIIRTPVEYENRRIEHILLTALHMVFSSLVFFVVLPLHLVYLLCKFIYHQIARLCYHGGASPRVNNGAELLGSGTRSVQPSLPESPVAAQP
jgi:hypothetical protein